MKDSTTEDEDLKIVATSAVTIHQVSLMARIPQDPSLEGTVGLLLDGYEFISKKCDYLESDIFETRLALEKTICLRGVEAAKIFYDTEKFSREGSAPRRIQKTLFGQGGVQGLDGKAHRHRKQMFMSLMSPERIADLVTLTRSQWYAAAKKWESMDRIVFFEAARTVLAKAVCEWAGVPLQPGEVEQRTSQLGAMIDGAGAIGPKHWKGKQARQQAEDWISDLIRSVRHYRMTPPTDSALSIIAWHKDLDGKLLPKETTAVELINVLRPTLAIGRYATFSAIALHQHPQEIQKVKDDERYREFFVQEVRRFYPFFPFAAARVKQRFDWQSYPFPAGRRVLLDLYGTNHDERLWKNPQTFSPERFGEWEEGRFDLIPQGGGDFYLNHRCPGEWITIALTKATIEFLTQNITYQVPKQSLDINLSQMPALPKSQFVISNVRVS